MLDSPCKSPDWPPERGLSPSCENATVATLSLFPRTGLLRPLAVFRAVAFLPLALDFAVVFFGAAFFFADFFAEVCFADFRGADLFVTRLLAGFFFALTFFDFVCFFFVFFLVAIRAVYHRPVVQRRDRRRTSQA